MNEIVRVLSQMCKLESEHRVILRGGRKNFIRIVEDGGCWKSLRERSEK